MKQRVPIKGWEGYEIDIQGNIWSCRDGVTYTHKLTEKWNQLKQTVSKRGYYNVSLRSPGIKKYAKVHRLLAEAFIPNPEQKPYVLHKDGNPLNNTLGNLYWGNAQDNNRDAVKHGTWWGNRPNPKLHCQGEGK